MPKPQETCTVIINGRQFVDWEAVSCTASAAETIRYATLQITESVGQNGAVGQALRIRPGDKCKVMLAGMPFLDGTIYERQVGYDANQHVVRVTAASNSLAASQNSIPIRDGNFRGYSFSAIANKLLQPLGISLKTKNPPDGWDKPFPNINAEPGESVWSLLDRLSKYRGVRLTDDSDGNLVAHGKLETQTKASLVEGRNIISASCQVIQSPQKRGDVVGSQPGSDTVSGDQARSSAATGEAKGGNVTTHRVVRMDIPGDGDDARRLAESEQMLAAAEQVVAQIVVQGWLTSEGKLVEPFMPIDVDSPMMILKTSKLVVSEIAFSQDNTGGTRTAVQLKLHQSRSPDAETGNGSSSAAEEATRDTSEPGKSVVVTDGKKGEETVSVTNG